jgi:hypothetical protein
LIHISFIYDADYQGYEISFRINKNMSCSIDIQQEKIFDEVFSGYQPLQVSVSNQRFEDRLGPHHQGSERKYAGSEDYIN